MQYYSISNYDVKNENFLPKSQTKHCYFSPKPRKIYDRDFNVDIIFLDTVEATIIPKIQSCVRLDVCLFPFIHSLVRLFILTSQILSSSSIPKITEVWNKLYFATCKKPYAYMLKTCCKAQDENPTLGIKYAI